MPSLSTRTIVYKGLLLAGQVGSVSMRICATRSAPRRLRWFTSGFRPTPSPAGSCAHPYRFIAHNGEINTVRGNVNWMNARRRTMESELLGADLDKMWPLIPHGQSDTACLDNALELLLAGGYSLAHAVMMLIPEAWAGNPMMDAGRRAFYEYHAALMEPWDGPAAVAFTDGRQIGATLDRNGLRPARFCVTDDDHVIMASETGVLPVKEDNIVRKWRLAAGQDAADRHGRRAASLRMKKSRPSLAKAEPYAEWLEAAQYKLKDLEEVEAARTRSPMTRPRCSIASRPLAIRRKISANSLSRWPRMAMIRLDRWARTRRLPCCPARSRLLYDYFKQNFAQVTNPPIDPIREELVM